MPVPIPSLVLPLVAIALAYLLGCLNTGWYLVKWRSGRDLRTLGSGNAGATNAGRMLGTWGFGVVLAGDAAKGMLAVAVSRWLALPDWLGAACAVTAVAGHLWPIQLGFRGGKGAATAAGAVILFDPRLGAALLVVAGVIALTLRRPATALIAALAGAPFPVLGLGHSPAAAACLGLLPLLLAVAHRRNLAAEWRRDGTPLPSA